MIITTKGPTPPEFTPIDVVITVQSQDELDALIDMARFDLSIPNMVESANTAVIKYFLKSLRAALKDC